MIALKWIVSGVLTGELVLWRSGSLFGRNQAVDTVIVQATAAGDPVPANTKLADVSQIILNVFAVK